MKQIIFDLRKVFSFSIQYWLIIHEKWVSIWSEISFFEGQMGSFFVQWKSHSLYKMTLNYSIFFQLLYLQVIIG